MLIRCNEISLTHNLSVPYTRIDNLRNFSRLNCSLKQLCEMTDKELVKTLGLELLYPNLINYVPLIGSVRLHKCAIETDVA